MIIIIIIITTITTMKHKRQKTVGECENARSSFTNFLREE